MVKLQQGVVYMLRQILPLSGHLKKLDKTARYDTITIMIQLQRGVVYMFWQIWPLSGHLKKLDKTARYLILQI